MTEIKPIISPPGDHDLFRLSQRFLAEVKTTDHEGNPKSSFLHMEFLQAPAELAKIEVLKMFVDPEEPDFEEYELKLHLMAAAVPVELEAITKIMSVVTLQGEPDAKNSMKLALQREVRISDFELAFRGGKGVVFFKGECKSPVIHIVKGVALMRWRASTVVGRGQLNALCRLVGAEDLILTAQNLQMQMFPHHEETIFEDSSELSEAASGHEESEEEAA